MRARRRVDAPETRGLARCGRWPRRFGGGALWFEFFYEEQLAAVRAAFLTDTQTDDEAILAQVR
eukprot:SAG11_NODE_12410_length_705_cov_0.900990_2_plen_63_part_01